MIAPPAAAYLLSDRLAVVLLLSALLAAVAALAGFWIAWWVDASIAGCMATAAGVIFLLALLFAPERGLVAQALRRQRQRYDFAQLMLTIHLLQHEGTSAAALESSERHLGEHLRWAPEFARRVVRGATREGWIEPGNAGALALTNEGRLAARRTLGESTGSGVASPAEAWQP
jgi:manganese/zinc/iron transport system permease protein